MSINTMNSCSSSTSLPSGETHPSSPDRITRMACTVIADTLEATLTKAFPSELISKVIEYIPLGPVQNVGDAIPSWLTYSSVCDAIKPWGEVQTIMRSSDGRFRLFVVKFHQPIQNAENGVRVFAQGSTHAPFFVRTISLNNEESFLLSQNMIAIDIHALAVNSCLLLPDVLQEACRSVQHRKLQEANIQNSLALEETIHENEKAEILFSWIRETGLQLLQRGVCGIRLSSEEYSKELIIKTYSQKRWEVIDAFSSSVVP